MEINNPADAIKYLDGSWSGRNAGPIKTVELLVQNSGYFEIPHLLMTYIEYLSGLFSGKGPGSQYSDVREFFNAYFPSKYQRPSAWLSLVHQYTPKSIRADNDKIISWYCSLDLAEVDNHLQILPHPNKGSNVYHLRIYATEFLTDFKVAISLFCNDILNSSIRYNNFRDGFIKYNEPEDLNRINKPYITRDDKDWLIKSL